jgi:hypothetical protein
MARSRSGAVVSATIVLLAVSAVTLLFSFALFGFAWRMWEQDRIVTGGAKEAPGVVGDHVFRAHTDLVRYEVDGHVYEVQAAELQGRSRRPGDTVTVLYRPDQPQLARVKDLFEQFVLPAIVAAFGLMTLGLGLLPIGALVFKDSGPGAPG